MIKQFLFFFSIVPITLCSYTLRGDFSLGPEAYYVNKTRASGSQQRGVLYGGVAAYNYLKPWSFYFGGDVYYATGPIQGRNRSGRILRSNLADTQAEGRIGYSFPYFTPFFGYGYLQENNDFRDPSPNTFHITDSIQYITVGFLSCYPLGTRVSIGLDAKIKEMVRGRSVITNDPANPAITLIMGDELQYRVDLPLSYKSERSGIITSFAPFYEFRHYGGHEGFPFDYIATEYQIWGGQLYFTLRF